MINANHILYFDLDETLMSVCLSSNVRRVLSHSAEEDLSKKPHGILKNPTLQNYGKNIFSNVKKIKAIAQKEFKKIFRRIEKINEKECRVVCCILTNATYEPRYISKYLKQFYGIKKPFHYYQNRFIKIENGKLSRRLTTKGQQMGVDYNCIFKKQGFDKKNIYLIDDNEINCQDAESNGFNAIRFPANKYTRLPESTYTQAKEKIFVQLNEILDRIEA